MKRFASCWAGLLLCAAAPFALAANTWTVTSTGSGGACTADSTTDANCTLDVALTYAGNGDTILFSASVQGQTIVGNFDVGNNGLTHGLTIDASPNGVVLDGGGIYTVVYVSSGPVTLSHLTIQHGLGGNSGGGIVNHNADLTIDSCTIANNSATLGGAGMYLMDGTTTIINSTIANNAAVVGGGIDAFGTLVIANSTITGNSASNGYGGGLFTSASVTLFSSIIAGNLGNGAPDIDSSGVTSLGYNIVGNTTSSNFGSPAAGDQLGVDPLFAATGLANNGGATQTVALQSLSPARNGGSCAGNDGNNGYAVIPALSLDQIGHTRTSPGAIGCTVGAFDMTSIFYNGFE
jgi:hypothetical protein